MCGICGILNIDSGAPVSGELIRNMCGALAHRGPDSEGVHLGWEVNGGHNAGIGSRRLSIIDLETGSQPLSNEDRTVFLTINGEIYNYRRLREDLRQKGHSFRTGTDAEAIVHLYEDYGIELLKHLRGPFAFALLDERNRELWLARDRTGQKPLYYTVSGGRLLFSSEIESILRVPGVERKVSDRAIHDYLTYQYVPYPDTAFEGIFKLPPAHYLLCREGKIETKKYWELDFTRKLKLTEKDYCSQLRDIFKESVRLRLESDVPLGVFLSGGIDSSIVAGVMSAIVNGPVKTFSAGFGEHGFDELKYARIVAEHFKTEHHESRVRLDIPRLLPELIRRLGEPFSDSSIIPSYYIAKMASGEVKVALNGDGGDENFAGYPRHKAVKLHEYFNLLPGGVKKYIACLAARLPEKNSQLRKGRAFLMSLGSSLAHRHGGYISIFDVDRKRGLYSEDFLRLTERYNPYDFLEKLHDESNAPDELDRMLHVDILSYLPCDLLAKMDAASMANSIEARSPFLDHKLMEFTAAMPPELKLKGFRAKYILKKTYLDFLPRAVIRRTKMGFGTPVSGWLRNELAPLFNDTVLSVKCMQRGILNEGCLRRMADEHMRGKVDNGHRLWSLLMLELWHRVFIDGDL